MPKCYLIDKKYLEVEWDPDRYPVYCCEEDGCVAHFLPDNPRQSYWCTHAAKESLHKHEGWYWVFCRPLQGYVRICEV